MVAQSKFVKTLENFPEKSIFKKKETQIALPFTLLRVRVEKTRVYIRNCHTAS